MTTSKESRLEREGCMIPSFGGNTALSYYSCNRYVTANDYSNFSTLSSLALQELSTIAACLDTATEKVIYITKDSPHPKSQKFFNAANDVFAAIAVSSYRYVRAVHQNISHSIHNPLAIFMHHYSPATQNVQLIVLRALSFLSW